MKFRSRIYKLNILVWIIFYLVQVSDADTKYSCIASMSSEDEGEMDEFEGEEESDEYESSIQSGSLSCSVSGQGIILVTRIAYGYGLTRSCSSSSICQDEFDVGGSVADRCDGQTSCYVTMLPSRYLACGRRSNYMVVEYECLNALATFDICEDMQTMVHTSAIVILSPGYLGQQRSRPARMCECIVRTPESEDLLLNFLQTKLSSEGNMCPNEYVLLESKRSLNQSAVDSSIEVCGRRRVGNQFVNGVARLTFASGGPMYNKGFAAMLSADPRSYQPSIEIECGVVNLSGEQTPPLVPAVSRISGTPGPPSVTSRGSWVGANARSFPNTNIQTDLSRGQSRSFPMSLTGWDDSRIDDATERFGPRLPFLGSQHDIFGFGNPGQQLSDHFPDTSNRRNRFPDPIRKSIRPSNARPPNSAQGNESVNAAQKEISSLTKTANSNTQQLPVSRPHSIPSTRVTPVQRGGSTPPAGKAGGLGVDEGDSSSATVEPIQQEHKSSTGSMVALVMGTIGAVLILASVGIFYFYNARKRRRIKAQERRERRHQIYGITGSTASSTYGKGWEMTESVYASVADVAAQACANPSVAETSFQISHSRDVHTSKPKASKHPVRSDEEIKSETNVIQKSDQYQNIKDISQQEKSTTEITVVEIHTQPKSESDDESENKFESNISDDKRLPNYPSRSRDKLKNSCQYCDRVHLTICPRIRSELMYDNNFGDGKKYFSEPTVV
ncbi:hypothetical protein ACJMK2_028717 [Sinanodonta woodiana]|uniref:SUEL-type lectin domain-containing protein n=1 Tax=Sinanodonta woodiana TaxID=1069815 RepID=A0ABD3X8C0_SINWO